MKRPDTSILNASFASRRRTLMSTSVVLVLALLVPTSAYAVFGLGDIVYDPTNYAEAVQELTQDIQIASQAIQTYNLLKSELAIITNRPWQTLATTLASVQIADLGDAPSASAQAVAQAVNGIQDARAAWSHANLSMNTEILNNALGSILSNTAAPAHATAIEMTDAFATDALRTLGLYRTNQTLLNTAIQNLETAQRSTDPADNTPAAQQNITNGILLQLLKLQQSAASLHAVVTEQLAAANSWQRNTAADNLTMLSNAIQSRNTAPADYAHTAQTLTDYLIH